MNLKNSIFLLVLLMFSQTAFPQNWPSKPITLVVSYPPGGSADTMARSLSGPLGKALGTTIIRK